MVALQLGADGAGPLAVGHTGGIHDGVCNGFVHADSAAQHAAAYVGMRASSNRPWMVPSSPFLPCMTGAQMSMWTSSALPSFSSQMPWSVRSGLRTQGCSRHPSPSCRRPWPRAWDCRPASGLPDDAHGEHLVSIGTGGLCQGAQPGRGRNTAGPRAHWTPPKKQRNAQLFSFVHSRKTPSTVIYRHTTSLQLIIIPYYAGGLP